MANQVILTLRTDDAEPILRKAAYEAAKNGALCDYMTRKTYDAPAGDRTQWQSRFLAAKRIVEAFGVEYEPTSEQETLTVMYEYVGGKRVNRGGMFTEIVGSKPDYANPRPRYQGEVHSYACHAAADRVVRAWRKMVQS